MVLPLVWQFGMSFIVFACACSTTNSKPFNLVLFQQLCGREVLWNWFYIFAACERLESMFVENVMFISTTVAWTIFTEIWMTSSLEFDALARCMSTTE